MDVLATIRRDLAGKPLRDIEAVAVAAGVNFHTFRKVVSGETKEPGYLLVDKLRAYLERRQARAKRSARRRA